MMLLLLLPPPWRRQQQHTSRLLPVLFICPPILVILLTASSDTPCSRCTCSALHKPVVAANFTVLLRQRLLLFEFYTHLCPCNLHPFVPPSSQTPFGATATDTGHLSRQELSSPCFDCLIPLFYYNSQYAQALLTPELQSNYDHRSTIILTSLKQ